MIFSFDTFALLLTTITLLLTLIISLNKKNTEDDKLGNECAQEYSSNKHWGDKNLRLSNFVTLGVECHNLGGSQTKMSHVF